jgi:hypothetical protein
MNTQKNTKSTAENIAKNSNKEPLTTPQATQDDSKAAQNQKEAEFGGRKNGPEPTRYGDWELKGKCVDF